MDSVADALHWLGLLERCAGYVAPSEQAQLTQLLFALFPLHQPLLTRHALGVLGVVVRGGGRPGGMGAGGLVDVVTMILQQVCLCWWWVGVGGVCECVCVVMYVVAVEACVVYKLLLHMIMYTYHI